MVIFRGVSVVRMLVLLRFAKSFDILSRSCRTGCKCDSTSLDRVSGSTPREDGSQAHFSPFRIIIVGTFRFPSSPSSSSSSSALHPSSLNLSPHFLRPSSVLVLIYEYPLRLFCNIVASSTSPNTSLRATKVDDRRPL